MWTLEARSAELMGEAAYVAAVVAFLLAQQLGLKLRREEDRAWWAGTGRDLLNLAGLLAIGGALRLLGFPTAAALLVGGTLTLLMFGASVFVATQTRAAHPRLWTFVAGLTLAAPVLVCRSTVLEGVGRLVAALFPNAP